MKKIIAMLSALSLLTLCGCSDSKKNENENDVKSSTEEVIDYNTLDTTWECDYLKVTVNSNLVVNETIRDSHIIASFNEPESRSHITIILDYSTYWKKQGEAELIRSWNELRNSMINSNDDIIEDFDKERYENSFIVDSFVKNGQAYLITNDGNSDAITFYADNLSGSISYSDDKKDTVLEMIDSIEFYV